MAAPQVSPKEVENLLATVSWAIDRYAECRPGPLMDTIKAAIAAGRKDEVFIADITPIVEDAITINAPYFNRLIDLNMPIVQRFIAAIKRQQTRGGL